MNRVHYHVSGLQNKQVSTQVKNALDNFDGIQMVNVDLGNRSIEVGYNDLIQESEIIKCIERIGCKIQ